MTIRAVFCVALLTLATSLVSGEGVTASDPASRQTARVACVAMHSEMGDVAANLDCVEQWLVKAHERGASFVVFPEECITGSLNKSSIDREHAARIAEEATKAAIPRLEPLCSKMQLTVTEVSKEVLASFRGSGGPHPDAIRETVKNSAGQPVQVYAVQPD